MKQTPDDALVLRDLVPAEPLLPDSSLPVWAWFFIASGTLFLGILIWYLIRRQKPVGMVDPRKVRDEAYRRAIAELEGPGTDTMQEAATRVSIALRRYLAVVSGDPALFETHEEFVGRHESLAKYPEELRRDTTEGFSHLARLKYGREANGDPATLFSTARQLLDRLHQYQPA
ncbi:hypothetical protein [Luteolibacter luteus]|jgi:hypothetical protein|uniref:Uncharacterized protein n=1 Tax=Luteolibacter luteus TaxID=2728835 RepID=A0A858RR97_9BACT|nr:hypothetical protein [Luteolibacter luteus]QJE99064.1 hypothetical protein HHL09_25890 [Luteolibacter luteus]